jgi:hypothetical protein
MLLLTLCSSAFILLVGTVVHLLRKYRSILLHTVVPANIKILVSIITVGSTVDKQFGVQVCRAERIYIIQTRLIQPPPFLLSLHPAIHTFLTLNPALFPFLSIHSLRTLFLCIPFLANRRSGPRHSLSFWMPLPSSPSTGAYSAASSACSKRAFTTT